MGAILHIGNIVMKNVLVQIFKEKKIPLFSSVVSTKYLAWKYPENLLFIVNYVPLYYHMLLTLKWIGPVSYLNKCPI